MPNVPMKEMLQDAAARGYAVPCFNAINLDMIRGIIQAAEEENSPVILCHAEIHFKYTPLEQIAPIMVAAMNNAKVPVSILLDHGKSFSATMKAMKLGFNAVMFDGSEYNYEDNVQRTAEVVKIAREFDVSVEGELGYVTRPVSGGAEGADDDSIIDDTSYYTDPEQAGEFVERTGVDALAVAFGTVHGVYLKKPNLDIHRLGQIRDNVAVPLVMHGGSGLSEVDFSDSIHQGIAKINYYTNMALKVSDKLREQLIEKQEHVFYHDIMMSTIHEFSEDARQVMRMFGSHQKA
ncbi:class II fructose-bisphosphate aldolase [Paenibacillus psychroresistens]|uniref:Class II fructose-bisphosphate aldolase n=1 Tax=Paenibacillus psychroresistens TaxID=1778678 RepID=A0A6B8RQT9_9BACL|nr:class II fructose-bisphosphate aldolase [Paenibacillus psychroresistens]QGQ98750.1 class II fructose-bisphosphate aldolase [Paenibacillus psychroresistens]